LQLVFVYLWHLKLVCIAIFIFHQHAWFENVGGVGCGSKISEKYLAIPIMRNVQVCWKCSLSCKHCMLV